jgi:hypothetical protein
MENYKILENRQNLSSKELTEAMNFTKLKANMAAAKMVTLKVMFMKLIFGAGIITSGILVYINVYTTSSKNNSAIALTDSISKTTEPGTKEAMNKPINKDSLKQERKAEIVVLTSSKTKSVLDTLKMNASNTTTIAPSVIQSVAINKAPVVDTVTATVSFNTNTCLTASTQKLSKNTKVKSCIIWRPNNYCDMATTLNFKYTMECDACEFDEVNCNLVSNTNDIVCVLVTLSGTQKQDFKIENKLNNISLINSASNDKQHPSMIGLGSANKFMGSNFKAKKCIVNFNKEINVILFFKNAKVGDKILINNFIEAQIEK